MRKLKKETLDIHHSQVQLLPVIIRAPVLLCSAHFALLQDHFAVAFLSKGKYKYKHKDKVKDKYNDDEK